MVKIFVGNLPQDVTSKDLEELFNHFGAIEKCNKVQNRSFGFVEMNDSDCANAAVTNLHKSVLKGSKIIVELSTVKLKQYKMFVGNITTKTSANELRELFESAGVNVTKADNCDGKKFGFVTFETSDGVGEVDRLIDELNGYQLHGSDIVVDLSQDDKKKLEEDFFSVRNHQQSGWRNAHKPSGGPSHNVWDDGYNQRGGGNRMNGGLQGFSGENFNAHHESLLGPVPLPDLGMTASWIRSVMEGGRKIIAEEKPEYEVYIGNYPAKFKEDDIRDMFEENDIMVRNIRMKHDGWKA